MASTEEDTFKRLKRLPFLEMREKWRSYPHDAREFRKFCEDHHWTVAEWFDEMYTEWVNDSEKVPPGESREQYVKRRSALYD